ncbi:MAG: metallophosphoesterase, partial [Lachnospiraceae bacterium]|nr:metallophosphoesterase [Lachnospiraceae bacterium]
DRSPKAWKLYGTNDISGEWVLLAAVEDGGLETVGANKLSSIFTIETPRAYQHYKIELIDTTNTTATQYKFRELFLYEGEIGSGEGDSESEENGKTLEQVKGRVDYDTIVVSGGAEGENTVDQLKTAFDMSTSSTCNVYVNSPVEGGNTTRTMQWTMLEPVQLEAYSFYTSSSAAGMFPKTWKFYGSNDAQNWVLLDDVENGNVTGYETEYMFTIDEPVEYQYYQLELISNNDNFATLQQYKFREMFLYKEKKAGEKVKPKYTEKVYETNDDELRILITSDTHYMDSLGTHYTGSIESYGVTEKDRAQLWVDSIKKEHAENPYDLILMLGDYSLDYWIKGGSVLEDKTSTTVSFLSDYVSQLPEVPKFILPGNHELQGEEAWVEMTGNYRNGVVLFGDILFILPDTYGSELDANYKTDGTYTPIDTDWVKEMMDKYPNTDVYILAHYIDQNQESAEFKELVAGNDRIKGMFMGHTHAADVKVLDEAWGNKTIAQTGNFSYYNGSASLNDNFWGFRELVITSDDAYSQYIIAESEADMDGDDILERIERETTSPVVYYGELPGIYDSLSEYVNVYDKIDQTSITGDAGVTEMEGPSAVFDGNIFTKYCVETVIGGDGTRTIQWAMTESLVLDAYAFFTGNDMYNRDPWAWTLYGSNDSGEDKTWTELSKVSEAKEEDVPEGRNKATSPFVIENTGEYKYYKFVITDNRNHRSEARDRHYQFSELVLLQKADDIASIDGVNYATLEDALNNAEAGKTVKLEANATLPESYEFLNKAIKLDLNGQSLTANGFVSSAAQVVDSSEGEGVLVVPKDSLTLANGSDIPVWDETASGYRFTKVTIIDKAEVKTEDALTFSMRPSFSSDYIGKLIAEGSDDSMVYVGVRLEWTDNAGMEYKYDCVLPQEWLSGMYGDPKDPKGIKLTISGGGTVQSFTATTIVKSKCGNDLTYKGEVHTFGTSK